MLRTAILLTVLSACISSNVQGDLKPYVVVDLGNVPDGNGVYARAINDVGQVAGTVYVDDPLNPNNNSPRAFLWEDGNMTNLGTAGYTNSHAYGINNAGEVVGWVSSTGASSAFKYDSSGMDLFGLTLGFPRSEARAINNQGQKTGSWTTPSISNRPYRYDGLIVDYASGVNDTTEGRGINDLGQVTGYTITPDGNRAFVWDQNGFVTFDGPDDGIGSGGAAINNLGQVAGHWMTSEMRVYSESSSVRIDRALLFDPVEGLTDLGTLGGYISYALDINDNGQVVGYSEFETDYFGFHAFLYEVDHGMVDLNDLIHPDAGWELTQASTINSEGQIVGHGRHNNSTKSFLLTPADLGDADLDGDVDLSDLAILAGNYGTLNPAEWWEGDFDGDGDVDLSDLGSLASNYGTGEAQAFADWQTIQIPEPATASTTTLLVLLMSSRPMRKTFSC